MLVVVGIVALMAGLAFPSFTSGLDGLRLRSASDTVASAINVAVNTADRRQVAVQLAFELRNNRIVLRAEDSRRDHIFEIPSGIRIQRILPALFMEDAQRDRYILIHPNGAPPQLIVELANARGSSRLIKLDPITGNAQVADRPNAVTAANAKP
jgi:type II secretory pathway pseudopilin PulG